MTITIKSFLSTEQNHPMKAEVIINWSVNVLQAKIILHLPSWFVISSCEGSAKFASKPRIQCNGKTNWTATEGAYNNSLEFTESFATVLSFEWIMLTVFSIWNMTPSRLVDWFLSGTWKRIDLCLPYFDEWEKFGNYGLVLFWVCLVVLVKKLINLINKLVMSAWKIEVKPSKSPTVYQTNYTLT